MLDEKMVVYQNENTAVGELCLLFCGMGDSLTLVIAGRARIKLSVGTIHLTAGTTAIAGHL